MLQRLGKFAGSYSKFYVSICFAQPWKFHSSFFSKAFQELKLKVKFRARYRLITKQGHLRIRSLSWSDDRIWLIPNANHLFRFTKSILPANWSWRFPFNRSETNSLWPLRWTFEKLMINKQINRVRPVAITSQAELLYFLTNNVYPEMHVSSHTSNWNSNECTVVPKNQRTSFPPNKVLLKQKLLRDSYLYACDTFCRVSQELQLNAAWHLALYPWTSSAPPNQKWLKCCKFIKV